MTKLPIPEPTTVPRPLPLSDPEPVQEAATPDYTQPPYVDADGCLTPLHPGYMAAKAKQDMDNQTDVNGAPKSMPRSR